MSFDKIRDFDPVNCLSVRDLSGDLFRRELNSNILKSGLIKTEKVAQF